MALGRDQREQGVRRLPLQQPHAEEQHRHGEGHARRQGHRQRAVAEAGEVGQVGGWVSEGWGYKVGQVGGWVSEGWGYVTCM